MYSAETEVSLSLFVSKDQTLEKNYIMLSVWSCVLPYFVGCFVKKAGYQSGLNIK